MSETISIAGLDKAGVLAALYNASRPQGLGFLHYDPQPMTAEKARGLLAQGSYFDYVMGRVLKVDLSSDELDPRSYDRDNGQGAAARAIEELRTGRGVASEEILAAHDSGKREAAKAALDLIDQASEFKVEGNQATLTLGLADVKDVLGPSIDRALRSEGDED